VKPEAELAEQVVLHQERGDGAEAILHDVLAGWSFSLRISTAASFEMTVALAQPGSFSVVEMTYFGIVFMQPRADHRSGLPGGGKDLVDASPDQHGVARK
jgi:hypothetical protein